jgi:hypothetical protein
LQVVDYEPSHFTLAMKGLPPKSGCRNSTKNPNETAKKPDFTKEFEDFIGKGQCSFKVVQCSSKVVQDLIFACF